MTKKTGRARTLPEGIVLDWADSGAVVAAALKEGVLADRHFGKKLIAAGMAHQRAMTALMDALAGIEADRKRAGLRLVKGTGK